MARAPAARRRRFPRGAAAGTGAVIALAAVAALLLPAVPAAAQQAETVAHHRPVPPFLGRVQPWEAAILAEAGLEVEVGGEARAALDDHRRLADALAALAPQRPGTIDAYLLSVALDSDPVFGREAREAARVLARRYGAEGRTIVLAGPDGAEGEPLPRGTPGSLAIALARIAELADAREDVLVLFATSHGSPAGIAYHYGDSGYGGISAARMAALLGELGIANRLLIVNACFSGSFVPGLASETSVVVAAAAADRSSFGCVPSNDWTYFGDAFVNRALRRPQPIADAFEEARGLIAGWEAEDGTAASEPRIGIGAAAARWLDPLEARMPRTATAPTGRPAH